MWKGGACVYEKWKHKVVSYKNEFHLDAWIPGIIFIIKAAWL